MEHIIVLLLGILISLNLISVRKFSKLKKPIISQSDVFHIIKDFLPRELFLKPVKETQAFAYEKKTNVRVIVLEDSAYWVKDNTFFVADISDGSIDNSSVQVVDTMSMDKVQLDKMLFIMDQLTEGE
jgi:hypothetical protein